MQGCPLLKKKKREAKRGDFWGSFFFSTVKGTGKRAKDVPVGKTPRVARGGLNFSPGLIESNSEQPGEGVSLLASKKRNSAGKRP